MSNLINSQGISFVIGARDEFPQIAMTIASLMEDCYLSGIDKFEFILMDNGSEDETSRFFAWRPIEKGGWWKYIYSPRGLVHSGKLRIFFDPVLSNVGTRNKGVLHARYENIIFSDAHINVRPGTIKSILTALNDFGGIIHAPTSWMGADGADPKPGYQYSYKVGEKIWGCVDEETEILTCGGWKKYNEIKKGDEIPTLNLQFNDIDIEPIEDVIIWDFDDYAVQLQNSNLDLLMTPDHRCIYKTRDIGEWRVKKAKDIKTSDKLPIATKGYNQIIRRKYNDDFVKLIGWVVTEGNYDSDGRVVITQYDRKKRQQIKECLDSLSFKYCVKKRGDFKICQTDSRKVKKIIPTKELEMGFLFKLTGKQLKLLYRTLIDGDGYWDTGGENFYQVSKKTSDAFQALCVLIGRPTRVKVKKPEYFGKNRFGKKPIHEIRIKSHKFVNGVSLNKKRKHYKGIMWCPKVENGTWFARRNGKVMPTGNTWNKLKIADKPFYIPLCGHCFMAVKRKQFIEYRGYPYAQRVYGGGEPYLDTKWWMVGSHALSDPGSLVYHLSAGRGYAWHGGDLIHNMILVAYILGGKKWADRIYITYLNKGGVNYDLLDLLYKEALFEGEEDKQWLDKHKIMTFEELLALDKPNDCKKCTKRGRPEPHAMRIWDKKNEELYGFHRSYVQEFKLRREGKKIFIGNTPIVTPEAVELASKYV